MQTYQINIKWVWLLLVYMLGVHVITLPSYYHFLNPIELLFGRLKAMIKRHNKLCDQSALLTTIWCMEQLRP